MDIFKQKRNLILTIVLLVILNIITLSLLWIGRPQPNENGPLDGQKGNKAHIQKLLKEELGFTVKQANQFISIRDKHLKNTRLISEEIRRVKRQMFDQAMGESNQQSISDSLLTLTLEKQKELEQAMFQHFIDINNLCTTDQKNNLKKLMHKLLAPPHPDGPPHGRNPEGLPPGQMREGHPPPRIN